MVTVLVILHRKMARGQLLFSDITMSPLMKYFLPSGTIARATEGEGLQ